MAETAARLACLPATGTRRVAAPQQPQQWLQAKAKELLEEEALLPTPPVQRGPQRKTLYRQ